MKWLPGGCGWATALLAALCCLSASDAAQLRAERGASELPLQTVAFDFLKSFDHLRKSVVRIQAVSADFDWLHPFIKGTDGVGLGSGFVVQTEPYPLFVTNEHVVNNAKQVKLQLLLYGEQQWDADVVSICPKFDVALLVLRDPAAFKEALGQSNIQLEALTLATRVAAMGEDVVALGFPLGQDALKISKGNIAGNEEVDDNLCIQSTAPVSPGSSGGPLLNADGSEVVGVNFAKATQGENINYVIPAWRVAQLVKKHLKDNPSLPENGTFARKYVQVPMMELTTIESNEALYEMSNGCSQGIYIARVGDRSFFRKASPAVASGSFLVEVNGVPLDRFGMGLNDKYAADRVKYADLLRMVPDLEAEVSFKTCTNGAATEHTVSMAWLEEYGRGISWVAEPHFANSEKEFEMFGDVGVMQMTWNHISAVLRSTGDPGPARWLHPDFIAQPRLVINYVRSGSYASDVIATGAAVEKVNGQKVRTLEEFRTHFRPANNSKVWILETDMGKVVAVMFNQSLEAQVREANQYGSTYLLTPGVVKAASEVGLMSGASQVSMDLTGPPTRLAPEVTKVGALAAKPAASAQPAPAQAKHAQHGHRKHGHHHHHRHHKAAPAQQKPMMMEVRAAGPLEAHASRPGGRRTREA